LRSAKIVCTLGPASMSEEVIRKLIDAGMDVARINFSHGTHEEHRMVFDIVRRLSGTVAVMQDLQGPKIRVGEIGAGEVQLQSGEALTLTTRKIVGNGRAVHVTYPRLPGDVSPGDNIYLADGIIHLEVERVENDDVHCRILHGGSLTSRKGVNLPGVRISAPALTEKDRWDLEFGIKLGVDYVALSFVRSGEEVKDLKRTLKAHGSSAGVVAKIERREALEDLGGIIDAVDALMIARGDLGVEIPAEEVPVVQKSIIAECRRRGKPVITATQMLESMVYSERPTRAEVADVANAVIDGTDAVMLSAETATGEYPIESVIMMNKIASRMERYEGSWMNREERGEHPGGDVSLVDAVCAGAVKVAGEIGASAIVCLTHSGRTARLIARHRPQVPVLALTDFPPVIRHMQLVWGVRGVAVDRIESTERIFAIVRERMREEGLGGKVVLTAGIPTTEKVPTNTVHVIDI